MELNWDFECVVEGKAGFKVPVLGFSCPSAEAVVIACAVAGVGVVEVASEERLDYGCRGADECYVDFEGDEDPEDEAYPFGFLH